MPPPRQRKQQRPDSRTVGRPPPHCPKAAAETFHPIRPHNRPLAPGRACACLTRHRQLPFEHREDRPTCQREHHSGQTPRKAPETVLQLSATLPRRTQLRVRPAQGRHQPRNHPAGADCRLSPASPPAQPPPPLPREDADSVLQRHDRHRPGCQRRTGSFSAAQGPSAPEPGARPQRQRRPEANRLSGSPSIPTW